MSSRAREFWTFMQRFRNRSRPVRRKSRNLSDPFYYDDLASVGKLCGSWSILFRFFVPTARRSLVGAFGGHLSIFVLLDLKQDDRSVQSHSTGPELAGEKWEGSIYKILWRHVLIYFCLYIALGLIYKFGLDAPTRKTFETICLCCSEYADSIPVVLFLGFFTGTIMQRWWAVHAAIPGAGRIITLATCYMKRNEPKSSKWLRTMVRYVLLSWMLTMRTVCRPIMRKYPTLLSMREAGLLLEHEQHILERHCRGEGHSKLSLHVINWALLLVRQGREEEIFESASDCPRLLDPIIAFKKSCSMVLKFKITAIPLSFVQAVALTVHAFGAVSLLGRQFFDHSQQPPQLVIDVFLPILPTMQYLAYLSWLKLAEVAVNPFGEDDDDFDIVELFQNHVQTAGDLLDLFELGHNNPIKESLEKTSETMFQVNEEPESPAFKTELNLPYVDDPESVELIITEYKGH